MPGLQLISVVLFLLLSRHGAARADEIVVVDEDDEDVVIAAGSSFHLHVSPPVVPDGAEERREHYRAMEAKDRLRHQWLIRPVVGGGGRRRARESSDMPEVMSDASMFELPMRSAVNIAQVDMYFVTVRFGTPALPYNLVLDTANELTWINCRLRRRKGKHYGRSSVAEQSTRTMSVAGAAPATVKAPVHKNWYRPALSSSWRRIRCSQEACALLPYNQCQSPNRTESCSYYQRVQDGTITSGIYGSETATVALSGGRMVKLAGLTLGCSTFEAGGSVESHDGVLSLGNGEGSFGVNAATRFGSRFSFCLLSTNSSRNASSYLTFGPNPAVLGPGTMDTPIAYNHDIPAAFGVHVTGITVGGQLLDIPPEVWSDQVKGGGVILDTGTSLTGLVPAAYAAVTAALDGQLAPQAPRVNQINGFDFCYNMSFAGDEPLNNVRVPSLVVELQDGARLEPKARAVVMPALPGVACLAFRKLLQGPGVLGNVIMQEHIWEFDHNGGRARFRMDKCTTHHMLHLNGTANTQLGKPPPAAGAGTPAPQPAVR